MSLCRRACKYVDFPIPPFIHPFVYSSIGVGSTGMRHEHATVRENTAYHRVCALVRSCVYVFMNSFIHSRLEAGVHSFFSFACGAAGARLQQLHPPISPW
eukprot:GHVU01055273.1.p1 GENE.GHVU01055273.1~~GHVU01055273.1.p1  ORF type:complete len:100 (-),score=4.21 GHVU01055273.1:477-776(-)